LSSSPSALLPMAQLLAIIARLRDPQHGCPWDLKQTHASLKRYLLEESQELLTAIDTQTPDHICEELGDVLLQVLLHAQIAQDNGQFDMARICTTLAHKLISRHPHVFAPAVFAAASDEEALTPEGVQTQWQQIKATEKAATVGKTIALTPPSILADVPKGLPALSRGLVASSKAVAVGFEWPNIESLWQCVMGEFDEFKEVTQGTYASKADYQDRLEDELGDCLFATINLGRHFGVDSEVALHRAIDKFTRRFKQMEAITPKPLTDLDFETWDDLWRQAKVNLGE
jgi:MazG family protein